MRWIADILECTAKEIVAGDFEWSPNAISISDLSKQPVVNQEIDDILNTVVSACKERELRTTKIQKY